MNTIVTITDITGMRPPFVCVAGVADDWHSIRIQFVGSRIDEDWLCHNGTAVVRPFARLGLSLLARKSEPPHTEDWYVENHILESYGQLNPARQVRFLSSICDPSVAAIFGTEILHDPGFYVLKGRGKRSLGTIRPDQICEVSYQRYEHGWDCRLRFVDNANEGYLLKVKDLSLCAYLDYLREKEILTCEQISQRLMKELNDKPCFLRIGLARGWAAYPERCYLQVTGVFTFPDYLQGRWFADFATPQAYHPAGPYYVPPEPGDRKVRENQAGCEAYTVSSSDEQETSEPY